MMASWLLNYAAFSLLCLAMERHCQDLLARKLALRTRLALRAGGWALLAISLWLALVSDDWAMGLVQWFAGLMAAGVLLVWLMTYRPRAALGVAGCGLLLGPLAGLGLF